MKTRTWSFILLVLITITPLFASVQGAIKGTVTDEKGNPLQGVLVTIAPAVSTQMKLKLTTNEKGYFIQTGLHPGLYIVTFSKEGYVTEVRRVRVRIDYKTTVNVVMRELPKQGLSAKIIKDYKKAISLIKNSNWKEAETILERLVKENPDKPDFYYDLAVVKKEQGKLDEALQLLKKAVQLKPLFPLAYKAMGIILAKQGKFNEAIAYLQKALQQHPSDAETSFNLGVCYSNLGENEKALQAFLKAIEIDNSYADAYFEAGMIYFALNKKKETVKMLTKFIQLAPNSPNVPTAKEIINMMKQ